MTNAEDVTIRVGAGTVSGLWLDPGGAVAALVLAHGAGGGMRQRFLENAARGLADRGIATLRYQFPYMEAGRGRPDTPAIATAAVRAAVASAETLAGGLPIFAGGKSFGGRMTSTAEAETPLPGVRGIIFFGFPLHPPGKPSTQRAEHLAAISRPMLFLQGSRDSFADLELLRPVIDGLTPRATLALFEGADHSFHVNKASGTTDSKVLHAVLDRVRDWADACLGQS